MRIAVLTNALSLGGTEKAACAWAVKLKQDGYDVFSVALQDGPRHGDLDRGGVPVFVEESSNIKALTESLSRADVIHVHAPGYPHVGDVVGQISRCGTKKTPVIETNIFGRLQNPAADAWTDFRLFISWTSCVQAARRSGRKLDQEFFRRQSVASYPVDPVSEEKQEQLRVEAWVLRERLGVKKDEILFGRFSRPEPNKWTDLPLEGFLKACARNQKIKLLLQEPPPRVAEAILGSEIRNRVLILKATADAEELQISQMACDAVLHGSSIGESFGYGIAEPMALGKPVIVNSTPWCDQAQIELVRHGECGLIASTPDAIATAILLLAEKQELRAEMGRFAQKHIENLADPETSLEKVKMAMKCAMEGHDNPFMDEDLQKALATAQYLDQHQWGHQWLETLCLRMQTAKVWLLRLLFGAKHKLRNASMIFSLWME